MKLWFKGQIENVRRFIMTTFIKFWAWLKQWLLHPIATYKERQFKNRRPVIHRSFDKRKLQYLVAFVIIIVAVIVYFSVALGSSKQVKSGETVTPSSSRVSKLQSSKTQTSDVANDGPKVTQNETKSSASKARETTSNGLKITGDTAKDMLTRVKTLIAGDWRRLGLGVAIIGAAILVFWDSTSSNNR